MTSPVLFLWRPHCVHKDIYLDGPYTLVLETPRLNPCMYWQGVVAFNCGAVFALICAVIVVIGVPTQVYSSIGARVELGLDTDHSSESSENRAFFFLLWFACDVGV